MPHTNCTRLLLSFIASGLLLSQLLHTSHGFSSLDSTCGETTISSISDRETNAIFLPKNILDNNFNTLWSNYGVDSWIQIDLGTNKNICSVNIAWYKGNQRQNNFVISTSQDGITFTKVLSSKSSGTTLNFEKYNFPITNARYLKVIVNGNTQNNYATITGVRVSTQNIIAEPLTIEGSSGIARDGVKMIYPTLMGGETWFFNHTNPDDDQFDRNGAKITRNADGSWHIKPGTTRMYTFTKNAGLLSDVVRASLPTYDYSKLSQIGYFYKPTDWKNVEITIYVNVSSYKNRNELSLVSRSVLHDTDAHDGCGGSSYHNNIQFTNGTFRYKKEMWHGNGNVTTYDIKPFSGIGIGSTMNKWIGFKGIIYNLPDGSVKLESYVDKNNNNNWQKATELIDKGDWGNDMTHCNANTQGAVITWGSPMIIFKSTGVTYDFKKLSVRTIVPPT